MYNYFESVKDDVLEALKDYDFTDFSDLDDFEEALNNDLWIDDSVTGNGSGSYTFSSYEAEKNLVGNWSLAIEALEEFGSDIRESFEKGPEFLDVTIRCYLLSSAISEALEEIADDFNAALEALDGSEPAAAC